LQGPGENEGIHEEEHHGLEHDFQVEDDVTRVRVERPVGQSHNKTFLFVIRGEEK
jgi:hypothetical protein